MATIQTNNALSPSRSRYGVAMFVVLGAIVMVTLFGYVGLTLAGRDQTISGDLMDIKSRDMALNSGLQIAVNRLIQDPIRMDSLFEWYLNDGKTGKTASPRAWFDFEKTPLELTDKEPDWYSIGTSSGDKTALKVRVLALGLDTSNLSRPYDSMEVYVTLECQARGRHGDMKTGQATYRIHGMSMLVGSQLDTVKIPEYAFYVGTSLTSSNMAMDASGGVYVAGSGGTFYNGGARQAVHGKFKWNGDLKLNDSITIDGDAYISGGVYTNSTGILRFLGNAAIGNGFQVMNASVVTTGNLWVGGTGTADAWNSGGSGNFLSVGGSLVFGPSDSKSSLPISILVGGNAWINHGFKELKLNNSTDSLRVGGSLVLGDSTKDWNTYISGNGGVRIGNKFFSPRAGDITSNVNVSVGDSTEIQGKATMTGSTTMRLSNYARIESTVGSFTISGGTIYSPLTSAPKKMLIPKAPDIKTLGIDSNMSYTAVEDNPMDSIIVNATRTAAVYNKIRALETVWAEAGMGNSITISAANLNTLYDYMKNSKQTLNGYMILRMSNSTSVSGFSDVSTDAFKGKMLMLVEDKKFDVNSNWPHSKDSTAIQLIVVRYGGNLGAWGWTYGNFAGIFYWENPPCENLSIKIGQGSNSSDPEPKMWGGILIGSHLSTKGSTWGPNDIYKGDECADGGSHVTPNSGKVKIIRDLTVYADIGSKLPFVLKGAKPGPGNNPTSVMIIPHAVQATHLSLTTYSPYFQPIGVFR